jgi:replicative DNA helicase
VGVMRDLQTFNPSGEPELFSIEAEQQLLGAVLTNNALWHRVAGLVEADHFYDPVHADIWRAAGGRIAKDHLASPVTLRTVLADHEGLAQLGGPGYLLKLAAAAISTGQIADYAGVVADLALKRLLNRALGEAQEGLGRVDTQEAITRLQHTLHALPQPKGGESSVSLLEATRSAVANAVENYHGRSAMLTTGIRALDDIIKGLGPGDLMLLGGATSMGKTAVALEIADNVAFRLRPEAEAPRKGYGVAFWSLEMEPNDLAIRMASSRSRVPYSSLRDASAMEEADFRKWVDGAKQLQAGAMRIIPKYIRDVAAAHAAIKRMQHEFTEACPLSLVVVDYFGLIRGPGKGGRFEMLTQVCTDLKTMAGLLGVPVILLVQLDRRIGEREDKRPQLFDLKETGQLENDADQVVFCHREEYWLRRAGPKLNRDGEVTDGAKADFEADLKQHRNKLELIVRKNRHGRLATAQVGFHDATNKFWDLQHDDPEDFI